MQNRSEDKAAVHPVRSVSTWQIITFVAPFVLMFAGSWAAMWYGQERMMVVAQADRKEQSIRNENLSEKIAELTAETKAMRAQMAEKSSKDAVQDAQISGLQNRVLSLEARR